MSGAYIICLIAAVAAFVSVVGLLLHRRQLAKQRSVVAAGSGECLIYEGKLHGLTEGGSEGMIWCLIDDRWDWPKNVIEFRDGDWLTVRDPDGVELFDGIILKDREVGKERHEHSQAYSQPCALGFWVHWTQHGWQPDDWAWLFIQHMFEGTEDRFCRGYLRRTVSPDP